MLINYHYIYMGCGSSSNPKVVTPEPIKQQLSPRKRSRQLTISSTAPPEPGVSTSSISKDYELQENIGNGAYSVVKRCLHKPTGQTRNVKILLKSKTSAGHIKEKHLLREVQRLRTLDHPNILRCYDLLEDESRFYLVKEHCEGGELFDKILELPKFGQADASKVMFQLLSAISYCHSQKVIHRDLKPGNIFLVSKGADFDIRISGFGSSAFLYINSSLIGGFGNAYYLAPEVHKHSYNELIDVWSAGMIMYVMLTGRTPYPGKDEQEVIANAIASPFDIRSAYQKGIPEDALDLLRGLLDLNVETRLSANDAIEHPWIARHRTPSHSSDLLSTLTALNTFNASNKLKDAVLTFLAIQAVGQEDLRALKATFQSLDKNGDGRISRAELLGEFSKKFSYEAAVDYVDEVLAKVDTDNSGLIDYTEFIKACSDKQSLLSMNNLEFAFNAFDRDGDGTISSKEIRELVGGNAQDESMWQQVINQVDQNGDGVVQLVEFKALMLSLQQ
jgi:calcium-dependent protein kinase